jgi:hypothetical protein
MLNIMFLVKGTVLCEIFIPTRDECPREMNVSPSKKSYHSSKILIILYLAFDSINTEKFYSK